MYSYYVPKVNQRNAILSDFTIDIQFTNLGNNNYSAAITVDNVGGNTTTGLKLQVTITESHLPISWGLSDEVNFVNRLMVPNQNGTVLDFSGGSTLVVNLNFTLQDYWDEQECEIIAFVQKPTKEILQGAKKFLAVPLFNVDAEAKRVVFPTTLDAFCVNTLEPIVYIKNMGSDNLTSCDIEYSINGGTPEIFSWIGNLGFNYRKRVELPAISFDSQSINTFTFSMVNPNNQTDPNTSNDALSIEFGIPPLIPTNLVKFELKTDQYPTETTWKVRNSAGTILYSGGPYSGANTVYTATWEFNEFDCFTYTIYDQYGDGICCVYGNGYYKLMDENDNVLIQGGQFGSQETKPFELNAEIAVITNFTADATNIIEGESVNFSDQSSGNILSWNWIFEGGDPATSTEQNPTVIYSTEGTYDVTLTISNEINPNTLVKQDYIEVSPLTGINNVNQSGVNIFPNPTTGKVFITGTETAKVNVYNATGTKVASFNEFINNTIDLSGLDNGIYFISVVKSDETTVNKKITILK